MKNVHGDQIKIEEVKQQIPHLNFLDTNAYEISHFEISKNLELEEQRELILDFQVFRLRVPGVSSKLLWEWGCRRMGCQISHKNSILQEECQSNVDHHPYEKSHFLATGEVFQHERQIENGEDVGLKHY